MQEAAGRHQISNRKLILSGILAISAVVLGVFLIMLLIAGFSLQNGLNNVSKVQPVFEKLCGVKPLQINSVYSQVFTTDYKSRVDILKFKELYIANQDFFDNCKGLLPRISIGDMLSGSKISYTNDPLKGESFSFLVRDRGKSLEVLMLKQTNSVWQIDQLFID